MTICCVILWDFSQICRGENNVSLIEGCPLDAHTQLEVLRDCGILVKLAGEKPTLKCAAIEDKTLKCTAVEDKTFDKSYKWPGNRVLLFDYSS